MELRVVQLHSLLDLLGLLEHVVDVLVQFQVLDGLSRCLILATPGEIA